MHIAYSAIQNTTPHNLGNQATAIRQHSIRLDAYQATCSKFSKEITAIQKFIPGWVPAYPVL
ncbi:MAG: hypothetical protein V4553_12980 [Bacteroidota bacterium]